MSRISKHSGWFLTAVFAGSNFSSSQGCVQNFDKRLCSFQFVLRPCLEFWFVETTLTTFQLVQRKFVFKIWLMIVLFSFRSCFQEQQIFDAMSTIENLRGELKTSEENAVQMLNTIGNLERRLTEQISNIDKLKKSESMKEVVACF